MSSSFLTETDILKNLVRKGAFTDACRELNAQIGSTEGKDEASVQREQLRQVARIWTALNKLIRS